MTPAPPITADVSTQIELLDARIDALVAEKAAVEAAAGVQHPLAQSALDIFQGYIGVLVVAFLVTLLVTPIVRRLAVSNGVIDHPDETRKQHRMPIAYLGGVAVLLGLLAGVFYSYIAPEISPDLLVHHESVFRVDGIFPPQLPLWIVAGFSVIAIVGLLDDVYGVSPRVKIGGQLFGAACLAWGGIGTNVAAGILSPTLGAWIGNPDLTWLLFTVPDSVPMLAGPIELDLIYWSGTAIIAFFVLGACNASNLIDGLDGLLSGVTAIATTGFLLLALYLAVRDDGPFDGPRIVLCLAVLGACLGFLPHNFNPATIFLGDCGSLLLGYCSAVMILSLGDTGKTFLVAGGIIIYGIPIVDTVLAIIRRKMSGKRMSDADSDHLHHMLKRALGVKGAVLALYAIGVAFCVLGVTMSQTKARFVYALAMLFVCYIVVYAIKIARRKQFEEEAAAILTGLAARPGSAPTDAAPAADDNSGDARVAEPGA
ncbi:MAG: undecaprenyl-phosphate alpha-N-acetylglucosaminyl 1-phosphate transferase [Phycisphaeraceae bacterium]|nr:MAG: undecaprenyl-phosphate alpha-N-acetylglucosaminyl 1-phosphate transferase [Phycisphaeraceae bacterium]